MNQQHGGKRPGAGRKVGSTNKKTRAVAVAAAALGMSPVEVMLQIMRKAHAAGDDGVALEAASKVAVYIHPRLSAVAVDLGTLDEHDLRSLAG
jgi:hypothetical protein